MGKRGKKPRVSPEEAKLSSNANTLNRISFLYQAAMVVAIQNPLLATRYVKQMKQIAQRTVIRIDPSFRRQLCPMCLYPLVPGKTIPLSGRGRPTCPVCEVEKATQRMPQPPTPSHPLKTDSNSNPGISSDPVCHCWECIQHWA